MRDQDALAGGHQTARLAPLRRRAARHGRSNLPASLTSFVGRSREVSSLPTLLAETRLLTLTGIGGIGKSRLAVEVARAAHGRIANEVCLVELAAITEPGQVVKAAASALGVQESPERPLLDALLTSLSGRSLLLVVDNCEHLVEATAELVLGLLRGCPDLRVLATSRVPLELSGETTWRVEPLGLPDPARLPERAALARYPAVRLFVERARAARPGFRLMDENAADVARICVRLDGIPLAIELAAARVGLLSPGQIGDRLGDRFHLLTGGSRSALPRHRTLRAMIDWSCDLLDQDERILFRRLAIFAGGWTIEAAEAVCADPPADGSGQVAGTDPGGQADGITRADVLDLLARLVARSLVVADHTHDETRFGLLETIREYGLERLREAGEEAHLRRRHADWVLALARQADPLLWTAEQRAWLARLDRELDNIRAALAWSAGPGEIEVGMWVAALLWRYWEQRGHALEARRWLGSLLDRADTDPGPARTRALLADAYIAHLTGDFEAARTRGDEGVALARAGDDQIAFVYGLLTQAIVHGTLGDLATATENLGQALSVAHSIGWQPGVCMTLVDLGILARMCGEPDRAAARFQEARALADAAGDGYAQAFCFTNLAHLSLQQSEWEAAAGWYRQSLAIWRDFDDVHNIASILEGLAWPLSAQGRAEEAARLFGAAEALFEVVGTAILPHWRADHERAEAAARAALGEEQFAAAWAAGRRMSLAQAIAYGLATGNERPAAPARPVGPGTTAAPGSLSARETEVARLVARGLTNRQIAEALVLQPSTVGNHLQRIYTRLGINGRAQLAVWVSEHDTAGDATT